ncbi:phytanoyl-CoA dioxygenase family protein [Calothrix sp. FACHB-156]|nr:phytanoyl-CoA dioxygenase family protein [Calothrix sp. FACHB-156]
MVLTQAQLKQYQEKGFILLPDYFSALELERMKTEQAHLLAGNADYTVLENDKTTIRSIHGSHTNSHVFQNLSQISRLVKPAMQILNSQVYVYQFKINIKAAFTGDVWQWHQDYIFWRKEDGMPTNRVTNVVIFLDDMNEFNGPLFFIPGSHQEGMIDVVPKNITDTKEQNDTQWSANFSNNLTYSLNCHTVANLVNKYGISAIKALAGSALFFDSNIVHASPSNISPFSRSVVIITYNSVENIPVSIQNKRPEFIVSQDYQSITPVSDSVLITK